MLTILIDQEIESVAQGNGDFPLALLETAKQCLLQFEPEFEDADGRIQFWVGFGRWIVDSWPIQSHVTTNVLEVVQRLRNEAQAKKTS